MAKTIRGREIDMDALRSANHHKPALGTASMNAGGDLIDRKGKVVKTRSQIDAEITAYFRENPYAVRQAPLNAIENEIMSPLDAVKNFKKAQTAAQIAASPDSTTVDASVSEKAPKQRKLSDAD